MKPERRAVPETCLERNKSMKSIQSITLAVVSLIWICAHQARAQGTAFTYQGRLTQSGNPANAQYEMQFTLFDAVTNGNPIGTPISVTPVAVTNGLFTVTLDFGGGAFNGGPPRLEITLNL